MRKLSHAAAVLLFSAIWTLAPASAPPAGENPSGTTQSSQQPGSVQTTVIEGCISSVVDGFVLTDANGKRYELSGNTNQLAGRVGEKVGVQGHTDSVREAELIPAGGPHAAFQVEKVHSLSAACK